MYDLERTVCDLVRSRRNFEIQDFNMAIKSYLQRNDKDLNRMMRYAKAFRIEKVIRQYRGLIVMYLTPAQIKGSIKNAAKQNEVS